MTEKIEKAETNANIVVPKASAEQGQPRIVTSSNFIQDQRKTELAMPKRLYTYDCMAEDDAVFNSIDVTNLLVIHALYKGQYVGTGTRKSERAADFLNYCIRNMSYGTWLEAMTNAATDLQYGFSLLNIVTEIRNYGKYSGSRVLKKLAPRDQKTVYGWVWDKDFREVKGFIQRPNTKQSKTPNQKLFENGLTELAIPRFKELKYPYIKSTQLLHFKHNSTNNNPQGDSPLNHCYKAWKEKTLIEKYEVIGVTKDFGGALVLRVPSELIERASDPDTYPSEAKEYADLQRDAALFHSGENAYIVLTSDTDDISKKYNFDVEFKGIDGGGKQYNTSELVEQKRKSIYSCFGTQVILLGQNGSGSYNLSSNQMSIHAHYVQRCIDNKVEILNTQLAKLLLQVNDIFLDYKDMPVFEAADPQPASADELSKAVQRMKSVGALTPNALKAIYKELGWDLDGIDELDFSSKGDSRAGESEGSSGVGDTQSGGSSSLSNMENGGSMAKQLTHDDGAITDSTTGELVGFITDDLDKDNQGS